MHTLVSQVMCTKSQGFSLPILIGIVAIIAVVSIVIYFGPSNDTVPAFFNGEDSTLENQEGVDDVASSQMLEKDETEEIADDTATEKKEGEMMPGGESVEQKATTYSGVVLAGNSAPLLDFRSSDYDAALNSGKVIVLYFYANWCPICKEETKNALYPAFNELTRDDVVGFRVNYKDSDTDTVEVNLARAFGVSYQHTKVILKNGERILKSPEGWGKERYITEITKALL